MGSNRASGARNRTAGGLLLAAGIGVAACMLSIPAVAGIGDPLERFAHPAGVAGDLAFHDGSLWASDWESGVLFRLDPASGAVLETVTAPCWRPEGLASDGALLYVSDAETGRIFGFDPKTDLTVRTYAAPESSPKGLAFGGGSLWVIDDGSDTIYELVPSDGTVLSYFKAPHENGRGLAHDGRRLWVTDRVRDELYAVLPEDGTVLFLVRTPGKYPCGLACEGARLWLADLQDRSIRRLRTEMDRPYAVADTVEREMRFRVSVRNDGEGRIAEARLVAAAPSDSIEHQFLTTAVRWEPEPAELAIDRWGQSVAIWRFADLGPGARVEAGYTVRARIGELHYAFYPEDVGALASIPRDLLEANTAATSRLQMDRGAVHETAESIVGEETNPYWIARKIYDWVRGALEYERVGGWDVPTTLIRRGTGSCSEYAFLYIALCRASGLPARYEGAITVRGDDASVDDVFHRWCEVYLPNIGWMPVDPSGGDGEWPSDHARYFGGLANRYLITTHGGGDSEHLGWDYNGTASWEYEGRGNVHAEMYGIWSAAEAEAEAEAEAP